MSTPHVLYGMALYAALVLITPGPTNALLLSAGLKAGFRNSWHLVMAEAAGYGVAIPLWGFFLVSFAAARPWLYDVVKAVSAFYILYLAATLWKSAHRQNTPSSLIGFGGMFAVTAINPKSPLFACAVFPPQAFKSLPYFGATMTIFIPLVVLCGAAWIALGSVITSKPKWAMRAAILLRTASLALVLFSGTLLFSILKQVTD
jgi:threonine/homoserine/homoserine lactone efflux protein